MRKKKTKAEAEKAAQEVCKQEMREKQEAISKYRYEIASEAVFPVRYGFGGDGGYSSGGFKSGYLVNRMIEARERRKDD
ncbi:MAG: hypothetical protein FWC93_05270 [Defluviitaleaceae bacterium]|nr:hypothetical protein [Defluviitaleaceae bacterium]